MKYFILIISFLMFFYSCKKNMEDSSNPSVEDCESPILEIPPVDTCFYLPIDATGSVITNYHQDYYFSPRFSKSVPDEFIFTRRKTNDEFRVYKTNLCNEYYEAGFDLASLVNPFVIDYNNEDEILISSEFKIWRVNFDGSNLFKVTDDNNNYYGMKWCLNDSLIYSQVTISDINSPHYPGAICLLDRLGNYVHVFPEGIGKTLAAPRGNKILTFATIADTYNLGYIDILTKEFQIIKEIEIPSPDDHYINGFRWIDDENIFYVRTKDQRSQKRYKMNINTLEVIFIEEEACENYGLGDFTISPFNQEEILMTRTEHRYVANHPDSLYYFQNIVKYNINTGEEKILDLNL